MIISPDDYLYTTDPETGKSRYVWDRETLTAAWGRTIGKAARALRSPKFKKLVLLVGIPASGKSTWLRSHRESDAVYIDATFVKAKDRKKPISLAKAAGKRVEAVVMNTPIAVCLSRNQCRSPDRRVPEDKVIDMAVTLTQQMPTPAEGFDRITQVRGKMATQDGVVETPAHFHPIEVQPPKAKRKKWPFEGFIDFQGIEIDVENVAGSTREGTDSDGTSWEVQMFYPYGEIRGTEGTDLDKLDVYVGPNHDASLVVVIHQVEPDTGKFDEDKVMLGFDSVEEAIGAYKKQYSKPGFYQDGEHIEMPIGQFWRWVQDRDNRGKKVTKDAAKMPDVEEARAKATAHEARAKKYRRGPRYISGSPYEKAATAHGAAAMLWRRVHNPTSHKGDLRALRKAEKASAQAVKADETAKKNDVEIDRLKAKFRRASAARIAARYLAEHEDKYVKDAAPRGLTAKDYERIMDEIAETPPLGFGEDVPGSPNNIQAGDLYEIMENRRQASLSPLEREWKKLAEATFELKGMVGMSSPKIDHAVHEAQKDLTLFLDEEDAEELIKSKKTRDGPSSHMTVFNPRDTGKIIADIIVDLQEKEPRLSKSKAKPRAKEELRGRLQRATQKGDWKALGIGHAEKGGNEAYFLVIDWPGGRTLRKDFGLPEHGQDFHVTLGFKGKDVFGVPKDKRSLVKMASRTAALVQAWDLPEEMDGEIEITFEPDGDWL